MIYIDTSNCIIYKYLYIYILRDREIYIKKLQNISSIKYSRWILVEVKEEM